MMASLPVSSSFQNALSNLGAASNGGSETLHVGLNRVDGIPLEADEGSSDGPPVVDTENGEPTQLLNEELATKAIGCVAATGSRVPGLLLHGSVIRLPRPAV